MIETRRDGVERSELEGNQSREADLSDARLASGQEPLTMERSSISGVERSDIKKRKGRPATERPFLSRENSSNGALKRPSELSGEILLGSERQCQGISR